MANETATATNPTDANASAATTTEASATLLAQAGDGTGKPAAAGQQTQTAETESTQSTGKPASETTTTEKPGEKPAAETTTTVAPEKYEFKAPEGTEFDPEVLTSFEAAAREANLSQDAAQKLIEKMAPALAARQVDQVTAIHKEWRDAASADTEFGGEKLAENLGVARKALDTFGTPQLRTLLDETGLGNHPEVIRVLFKVGKAISEDGYVGGRTGAKTGVDATTVLYPTMTKKE